MGIKYDKLWIMMKNRKITKTQLCERAHITTNAMVHLSKNEDVRVETLVKICNVLNCTIDEITELSK